MFQFGLISHCTIPTLSPHRPKPVSNPLLNGDVVAYQLEPNTVYIQVSAITSQVASEVAIALTKYSHKNGVVLDLRDNPGGLIEVAVELTSIFLCEGTIVSYSRKN